jgi:hypothetical protein
MDEEWRFRKVAARRLREVKLRRAGQAASINGLVLPLAANANSGRDPRFLGAHQSAGGGDIQASVESAATRTKVDNGRFAAIDSRTPTVAVHMYSQRIDKPAGASLRMPRSCRDSGGWAVQRRRGVVGAAGGHVDRRFEHGKWGSRCCIAGAGTIPRRA